MTAPRDRTIGPATAPDGSLARHPVWWGAVGYCALLLAAHWWGEGVAFLDTVATWSQYLPLTLTGLVVFALAANRGAHLPRGTRAAVRLVAAALACLALGMLGYLWSHSFEGEALGVAILGDLFYLPGYALLLAALLAFPTRRRTAYRGWQFTLDTLVVLAGAGLAMWYFVVRPTTATDSGGFDLFVRLAYPALGLGFLLALNAVALRGGARDHTGSFRLLAIGTISYVVADAAYQVSYYAGSRPVPLVERLSETAYTLAYLLWIGAGLRMLRAPKAEAGHDAVRDETVASPLPLVVAGGVAVLLTAVAFVPWRPESSPLVLGLVALTAALVTRLGFTARQNAELLREQARRQGDTRVAALVRHASDLIIVTEPDARIRFASPSMQGLLGRDPETMTEAWVGVLVHPEDRERLASVVAEARAALDARTTATLRLVHGDGSLRECEVVITDLSREPAVAGLVFVVRDLTERRALESRLNQAQRMEAVGRLAGGIAHDFNNMLTTILAETDLLLDRPQRTAADREDLLTIRHAGQQAATLTRQLLAFARQQVPATRAVDLDALVAGAIRMFGHPDPALTLERRTARGLPPAHVDPNQISQVLLNLLLNARDAMPEGGRITVSLGEQVTDGTGSWTVAPAPGRFVVLEVQDNGIGMDAEAMARAFEPFYTTKGSGRGTGLGLPSVLTTVERHRGGLRLQSTPGVGTTVTILLPVAAAPAAELPEPIGPLSPPRGRERLLLVDDEAAVRDVTRRILERLGYEVEVAANAEQARRVVAVGGRPDLMVTDVMMPGESGPELADALRARCPGLPVLFISGFAGEELHRQGTIHPGTILLQKPYTPQELGEAVRGVLDAVEVAGMVGTGEIASAVRS